MTLPNKPITDRFILEINPRVVNEHVESFLEICYPYLSHIPSIQISENNLKYCINAFYGTFTFSESTVNFFFFLKILSILQVHIRYNMLLFHKVSKDL